MMDMEKSPAAGGGGLPPQASTSAARFSGFSPNAVLFTLKSETSTPAPSGNGSLFGHRHDIFSQMPDNPPKSHGHRRAHSEILTLPDDLSFDSDLGVVGGGDRPSFSDETEEDLLLIYLNMDKFDGSATSSLQLGEPSCVPLGAGMGSSGTEGTVAGTSERPRIRHRHSHSMDWSTSIKPKMLVSGADRWRKRGSRERAREEKIKSKQKSIQWNLSFHL